MASPVQRRRTYHYPSDTEDTPAVVLDEQEQDHLIQTLVKENSTTNRTYTRALLMLSLLAIVPYLRTLLTPGTTFLSLLGITSLLVTIYLLTTLPPENTGLAILDYNPQSHLSPNLLNSQGPLVHYLPYLNVVLCAIQAVLGTVTRHQDVDLWFGFTWLPAAIYGAVLLAKWMMGGVNPARDLNNLRYELKGA